MFNFDWSASLLENYHLSNFTLGCWNSIFSNSSKINHLSSLYCKNVNKINGSKVLIKKAYPCKSASLSNHSLFAINIKNELIIWMVPNECRVNPSFLSFFIFHDPSWSICPNICLNNVINKTTKMMFSILPWKNHPHQKSICMLDLKYLHVIQKKGNAVRQIK